MPAERVAMRQAREIIRLKFSADMPTRERPRRIARNGLVGDHGIRRDYRPADDYAAHDPASPHQDAHFHASLSYRWTAVSTTCVSFCRAAEVAAPNQSIALC